MRNESVIRETIIFEGFKFHRYPNSNTKSHRRYFSGVYNGRKTRLHVAVWESANGERVPKGYAIHHIDHDWNNNDPTNLECLPKGRHQSHHASQPESIVRVKKSLDKARDAAKAWHGSEAGLAWHSEHAKDTILKNMVPKPVICGHCGKHDTSKTPWRYKYCSTRCKQRQNNRLPATPTTRTCEVCSCAFQVEHKRGETNRKYCSRACTSRAHYLRRSAGL